MTAPLRYRWQCADVKYGRGFDRLAAHRGFDFLWDGVVDPLRPETQTKASLLKEAAEHGARCTCVKAPNIAPYMELRVLHKDDRGYIDDMDPHVFTGQGAVTHLGFPKEFIESLNLASAQLRSIMTSLQVSSKENTELLKFIAENQKREKETMARAVEEASTFETVKETVKDDAAEAGWMIAANQSVKVARTFLLTAMQRSLPKKYKAWLATFSTLLATPYGEAALGYVLALFLLAAPGSKNSLKRQMLAKKLRVGAMAQAGGGVADVIREFVMNDVMLVQLDSLLESLPMSELAGESGGIGVRETAREFATAPAL